MTFLKLSISILAYVVLLSVNACSSESKGDNANRVGMNATGKSAAAKTPATPKGTSGRKAPGFELTDLKGNSLKWSQYDGKVVLVDFWATWCGPCRRSIPDLSDLHQKYSDRGFEVLGISLDQTGPEGVSQFVAKMNIPYRVAIGNLRLAQDWDIGDAIPVAFLVNRQGNIVEKFVGYQDRAALVKKIEKYL